MRVRCGLLVCAALVLAACASPDARRGGRAAAADGEAERCLALYRALDEAVDAAGVRDAQSARIPGYPYLRADRFLASFADDALSSVEFRAWVARLRKLDEEARAIEVDNLPEDHHARLVAAVPQLDGAEGPLALRRCAERLAKADLAEATGRLRMRAAVRVPPEYDAVYRAIGLYPLTRIPVAAGVRRWQAETRAAFAADAAAAGERLRYAPPEEARAGAQEIAAILERARGDPQGMADLRGEERRRLFMAFAPELEIDQAGETDRIGALWYRGTGLSVETDRPVLYTRLSHTRYRGRTLLQLNYSFWFPGRPRSAPLDPLAGFLDGLTWRVTLGPDGRPFVYDTIHNCGCYHLFLPTQRAMVRAQPRSLDETAFVPQHLPALEAGDRVVLRMAARTHQLQRVLVNAAAGAAPLRYAVGDDDGLRSLPLGDGRRSAFGPDGIVAGTGRLERLYLWPMGVHDAGAMRQWGRHATAFVGRRHFDDPDLFEKYFRLKE